MEFNWIVLFLAALIPLAIGSIWYNPKVFGNIWMRVSGVTEEKLKTGNMAIIFLLTYIFSLLVCVGLLSLTVHQLGLIGLFEGLPGFMEEGTEIQNLFDDIMSQHGNNHRNFPHGAMHGAIAAFAFALPIIGINALFERRGWKYIWVHFGYWLVCLMLMSGVISHFI